MIQAGNVQAHRIFTANASLYRTFPHYSPPCFLKRNLRQVLDAHERLLDADDTSYGSTGASTPADQPTIKAWALSTPDMSEHALQRPVLRLDALQICPQTWRQGTVKSTPHHRHHPDDPDWLYSSASEPGVPAQISLHVYDTRTWKKPVLIDHRSGRIVQRRQDDSEYFDIVLEEAFTIDAHKLYVVTNGARSWKQPAATNHTMELHVQCLHVRDHIRLVSHVEGKPPAFFADIPEYELALRVSWDALPACPARDQLLPLRRVKGHHSIEMQWSLALSMAWNRRDGSLLESSNRNNAALMQTKSQLPSPGPSSEERETANTTIILYKYHEGLETYTLIAQGLSCPLCRTGLEHSTFDRLHLHLITHHDHFDFEADDEPEVCDDSSEIRRTISLSLGDARLERLAKFDDEWQWMAPDEPFNLKAELRGERQFLPSTRPQNVRGRSGRKPQHRDKAARRQLHPVVRQDPAPGDVKDLPPTVVKKHMVPNVPGVTFYDLKSKRRLEGGEMVADDDDDDVRSECAWLRQSRDAAAEKRGISGARRDASNALDDMYARERPGSMTLINEGLVRFVRDHAVQLRDSQWQTEFWRRVDQLREHGIVKQVFYAFFTANVDRSIEDSPREDGYGINAPADRHRAANDRIPRGVLRASERQRWDSVSFDFVAHEPTSPGREAKRAKSASEARTGKRHGCSCGRLATGMRGTIACDSPRCANGPFHLACLGLEHRPAGWQCYDCASIP